MAEYTENCSLELPSKSENYSIEVANKNNRIIDSELGNKQTKQTGKGLSTNDFTDEYKRKLDSLENYNDTALADRVSTNKTNIAGNTTRITNLEVSTTLLKQEITITSKVSKETNYELPLSYRVGNNSLRIFWKGVLLECGQDGNYIEIGNSEELSNIVQFGWDLEIGDVLTIEVRGVVDEE